jgi:hypothetical protein
MVERNEHIFNNANTTLAKVVDLVREHSELWCQAKLCSRSLLLGMESFVVMPGRGVVISSSSILI